MRKEPVGLPTEWQRCPRCPPEEGAWPPEAFSEWHRIDQRQSKPKDPICNACLFESYPKVYRACLTCGRAMHRRSQKSDRTGCEAGRCRLCRTEAPVVCVSCQAPADGLSMVGDECLACWLKGDEAGTVLATTEIAR